MVSKVNIGQPSLIKKPNLPEARPVPGLRTYKSPDYLAVFCFPVTAVFMGINDDEPFAMSTFDINLGSGSLGHDLATHTAEIGQQLTDIPLCPLMLRNHT